MSDKGPVSQRYKNPKNIKSTVKKAKGRLDFYPKKKCGMDKSPLILISLIIRFRSVLGHVEYVLVPFRHT